MMFRRQSYLRFRELNEANITYLWLVMLSRAYTVSGLQSLRFLKAKEAVILIMTVIARELC